MTMFSSRTNWDLQPNRLARRVTELRVEGQELLDLTESNPTRAGFAYLDAAWLAELSVPAAASYDPEPRGLLAARTAVRDRYRKRGIELTAERFFLTSGTSEAYAHLFRLLLEPGEAALVPTPSYPLFDFLGDINDVTLIPYSLHYDGVWWIDMDELERRITPACRAIVLVSPNNPTGSVLSVKEGDALCRIAAAHDLALIADEVFADFILSPSASAAPSMAGEDRVLTFTLGGLSKSLGMPQMKVAWTAVNGPATIVDEACRRLEVLSDTFLSVNTPAQLALPVWLARADEARVAIMDRLKTNHRACLQSVADPVELLHVDGGWSVVLRLPATRSDEEWCLLLLEEEGVIADPGAYYGFGQGAHVVISLLTPVDAFRAGVERIAARVSATRQ